MRYNTYRDNSVEDKMRNSKSTNNLIEGKKKVLRFKLSEPSNIPMVPKSARERGHSLV